MSQDKSKQGTLANNMPRILIEDAIDLDNLSLAWPQVIKDRQRTSQVLVKRQACQTFLPVEVMLTSRRFYSQILYGCGNSLCKTPFCASCQKRTSKKPFRKFTTLSARALAIHLASRDHAGKYLCPHQSISMRHTTEQDRLSSHERQSKPVGRSQSCMGLPTQQSSLVLNPPVCQSQLKQLVSQETSKTVDNSRSPSGARPGASKQKDSKSFAQNLFDTTAIDKFLNAPTSVDKTAVPSNRQQKVAAKAVHPQPEEKESIAKADCEPVRRQGHHFEHKASHYLSSCKHTLDPPVDRVKTDHSCFNKTRRSPSSLRSPKPQQTLSHLSMQNVKALISAAQKSNNESLKRQHLEHNLHQFTSQATPAITSILSFARQSIAYVFSTPQALLASFREDAASGDPSDPGEPIDFGCMVQTFQWLDKLDTRPRLVMSSLLTATKGLRTPIDGLIEQDGRASELPTRENIRAHSLLANTNPEDDDFRAMNQEEATHVTMFVFAALIAIVPPCSLEIWCLVYQCHQAGSMVPNRVKDPATISSVQVVLDAFEDEMALDLLSKLCEVLAGRLYFSRTENLSGRGEELYNDGGNMVERLIDHVFDSQQRPLPYYGTNPQTGSEQLSPPAKNGASWDSQRYFAIIAEWLRYFIVKNWDGQAEIDRFSAVGGALEILWHFSKYRYCTLGC